MEGFSFSQLYSRKLKEPKAEGTNHSGTRIKTYLVQ